MNQSLKVSYTDSTAKNQMQDASRPARIPEGHERVFKALDNLHNTITQLEARLQPALRIEPETGSPTKAEAPHTPVTIYDKLDSHNDSINCANNRIADLLRLLEI